MFELNNSTDVSVIRMSLLETQNWVLQSNVQQLMGAMQKMQRQSTLLARMSHRLRCH